MLYNTNLLNTLDNFSFKILPYKKANEFENYLDLSLFNLIRKRMNKGSFRRFFEIDVIK